MLRSYFLTILALLAIFSLPMLPSSIGGTAKILADSGPPTLLLNEICPAPSNGPVWVELINPSDSPIPLDGYLLEFLSGFKFTFESGSGDVTTGDVHILNISGPNPLNPTGDGCVLSSPDGPVDAITWAEIPDTTAMAIPSGDPLRPDYEIFDADEELYLPDDVLIRLPGTWPPEISNRTGSDNWVYRRAGSESPGQPNPWPQPWIMLPNHGARAASDFSLAVGGTGWEIGITFQVTTDELFENIVIEETVEGNSLFIDSIEPGTYYWRAKSPNSETWCDHRKFIRLDLDLNALVSPTGSTSGLDGNGARIAQSKGGGGDFEITDMHLIGLRHINQRKDTGMVCLDGCVMNGELAWDTQHPYGSHAGGHNPKYCARACIATIADQNSQSLSQDRISFQLFERFGTASVMARETGHIGDPFGDLGHGKGVAYIDIQLALNWIYSQPAGSSKVWVFWANVFDDPSAAPDSVKEFIDIGRPIIYGHGHHARVIDGYAILLENEIMVTNFVHLIDPWYTDAQSAAWFDFNPNTHDVFISPPTTGSPSVSDEETLHLDSDADGLTDFDEIERFHTDPNNPDSDIDGVYDKQDMLGYLFNPAGSYNLQNRDTDSDGFPKELDPDNDNASNLSSLDGCEDADQDGFYSSNRETDNFNPDDDFNIINPDCLKGEIKIEVIGTRHDSEVDFNYYYLEEVRIENGDWDSNEYVHPFRYVQDLECVDSEGNHTFGHDSADGYARCQLDFNPETGEYFLIIDTNTPEHTWVHNVVTPYFPPIITESLTIYSLDNDARCNIGVPQEVDGGLLCKGIWEGLAGLNVEGPRIYTWEIWITPPDR